jgi:hypothetical protein
MQNSMDVANHRKREFESGSGSHVNRIEDPNLAHQNLGSIFSQKGSTTNRDLLPLNFKLSSESSNSSRRENEGKRIQLSDAKSAVAAFPCPSRSRD